MFEGRCTLCGKTFSVGHGGKNDVTQHSKSEAHTKAVEAARSSSVRSYFVIAAPIGVDRQVSLSHSLSHTHMCNTKIQVRIQEF
jgi:hypothetical protein